MNKESKFKVGQKVQAHLFYSTVAAQVTSVIFDSIQDSFFYTLEVLSSVSLSDAAPVRAGSSMTVSRVPESSLQFLSRITG